MSCMPYKHLVHVGGGDVKHAAINFKLVDNYYFDLTLKMCLKIIQSWGMGGVDSSAMIVIKIML